MSGSLLGLLHFCLVSILLKAPCFLKWNEVLENLFPYFPFFFEGFLKHLPDKWTTHLLCCRRTFCRGEKECILRLWRTFHGDENGESPRSIFHPSYTCTYQQLPSRTSPEISAHRHSVVEELFKGVVGRCLVSSRLVSCCRSRRFEFEFWSRRDDDEAEVMTKPTTTSRQFKFEFELKLKLNTRSHTGFFWTSTTKKKWRRSRSDNEADDDEADDNEKASVKEMVSECPVNVTEPLHVEILLV